MKKEWITPQLEELDVSKTMKCWPELKSASAEAESDFWDDKLCDS
ncbi:paeninodin family lasso peptide [Virgibacillus sp. W0430]